MNPKTLCSKHYAAMIRQIWREENSRCFAGNLQRMPHIKQYDDADFGAYYSGELHRLAVNREPYDTVQSLREVIIHEMIHQQQAQHTSKYIRREFHGRFFRRRSAEIQKIVGFDPVAMYPKKGTPGFYLTRPTWAKDLDLSSPGRIIHNHKRGENCPHCKG